MHQADDPNSTATASIPGNQRLGAAIQKFHANVDQLLAIESRAEHRFRTGQQALVHAGKMASLGRMVAGVNHEIKRPLASVRLLTESSLDLLARGNIERAAENLHRLMGIVDRLSTLSCRLESFARKAEPEVRPVRILNVVSDALTVLIPQIQVSQCKVEVDCGEQMVLADRDRLTFVIVNVVDNAIGAVADAADKRIDITVSSGPAGTVVRIRDRGPGLSEHVCAHLFEAFFTTKPPGKGLGLGLALCVELLEGMHGQVSGRNHPDGGAEFSICLQSDPARPERG